MRVCRSWLMMSKRHFFFLVFREEWLAASFHELLVVRFFIGLCSWETTWSACGMTRRI